MEKKSVSTIYSAPPQLVAEQDQLSVRGLRVERSDDFVGVDDAGGRLFVDHPLLGCDDHGGRPAHGDAVIRAPLWLWFWSWNAGGAGADRLPIPASGVSPGSGGSASGP
ncbi:MAG: hypothetical protein JWQ49_4557 [Edaphobacter sp.]|nr:hypothetical protein [Edaphobacter sp.]